jgi:tetratricopeptide (TPR) repeat protein
MPKSLIEAIDVCEKVLAEAPNDGGFRDRLAESHFALAEVLRAESRLDEAEKHYRLAEAAWRKLAADNPTDPVYRIRAIGTRANQLSPLLTAKDRGREAEENYREAVGLLASLPASELVADERRDLTDLCYGNLVRSLKSSNRPQEATAVFGEWLDLRRKAFTKMLEQNPKSADAQNSFGEALARVGCWEEALAAIDKAAELDPANHWYPFRAAPLHLRAGDVAGYRRVCRTMLEQFHGTQALEIADRTAKTCLLAPDAVPDLDRVQKLADLAVTGTEKQGDYRWFTFVKGLAEYRASRHAEAVKWLERSGPNADGAQIDASAFAVLAMAQHRLGQKKQARAALHNGQAIVAEKMPDPAAGRPFEGMWQDWLHCQILLREAEALVKPDQKHLLQTQQIK